MCLQVAPLDRHSGVLPELAHGWAALPGSAAFLFEMIGRISTRAQIERRGAFGGLYESNDPRSGGLRARPAFDASRRRSPLRLNPPGQRCRAIPRRTARTIVTLIQLRLLQHPEGPCVDLILTLPAFSRLTSA